MKIRRGDSPGDDPLFYLAGVSGHLNYIFGRDIVKEFMQTCEVINEENEYFKKASGELRLHKKREAASFSKVCILKDCCFFAIFPSSAFYIVGMPLGSC